MNRIHVTELFFPNERVRKAEVRIDRVFAAFLFVFLFAARLGPLVGTGAEGGVGLARSVGFAFLTAATATSIVYGCARVFRKVQTVYRNRTGRKLTSQLERRVRDTESKHPFVRVVPASESELFLRWFTGRSFRRAVVTTESGEFPFAVRTPDAPAEGFTGRMYRIDRALGVPTYVVLPEAESAASRADDDSDSDSAAA